MIKTTTWAPPLPTIEALLASSLPNDEPHMRRCYPVRDRGPQAVAQLEARAGHVEVRSVDWAVVRVGDRRVLVLLREEAEQGSGKRTHDH